jgi:hypothetical protein
MQFSEDKVNSDSNQSIISLPKPSKTHPISSTISSLDISIFNKEEFSLTKEANFKNIYIFK